VTVLVSSHILHEVESMTRKVLLLYQGRVLAEGRIEEIRALLSRYPHKMVLRSPRARELGQALFRCEGVTGVRLEDGRVFVDARDPDAVHELLPRLVLEEGIPVHSLETTDASLEAVFQYLVR
jgi:ABC-2 type transport system ATP-binding protein